MEGRGYLSVFSDDVVVFGIFELHYLDDFFCDGRRLGSAGDDFFHHESEEAAVVLEHW